MTKEIISTNKAPAAIGPYVQAIKTGGFLFLSGQLGIDNKTGEIPEHVEDQAHNAFKNIEAILHETGISFNNIIKTTVFLTEMSDFANINKIYGEYFKDSYPARSCVAVKALPKDAKFEIECIAAL